MSAATDVFVKQNQHRLLEELKQFLAHPQHQHPARKWMSIAPPTRRRGFAHRR
jgi:hypothetical protein